jgi:purine-binding chemotaxis protein CheW
MTITNEEKKKIDKTADESQREKYLTFKLAEEIYGVEIIKVREIIGMLPITRMPRMPEDVRGVINLRGKVIPVIDLRIKFKMEATEATSETCIIVVDIRDANGELLVGILVDGVSEVLDILESDIDDAPELGDSVATTYISGVAKAGDKVVILLDILSVLDLESINAIK